MLKRVPVHTEGEGLILSSEYGHVTVPEIVPTEIRSTKAQGILLLVRLRARIAHRFSQLQGLSGQDWRQAEAVLACLSYSICSTSLTLANKAVFSAATFRYVWAPLCIQSAVAALILICYLYARGLPALSTRLLRDMFAPCSLFTLYIYSNALALRSVSIPVLSVVKSLAPAGVAIFEALIFGDRMPVLSFVAMALILVGNAVTRIHDIEFNAQGYSWAFANVVLNIAYYVSLRLCLSDNFGALEKTLHSNILAVAFTFPAAALSGELDTFSQDFADTDTGFKFVFCISCMVAVGIGTSVFWAISTSSASTLSFVGAANKFVVVFLGALLFGASVSFAGWVGIIIALVAGVLFAAAKSVAPGMKRKEAVVHTPSTENEKTEGELNGVL